MNVLGVIPARYGSVRFPGKALVPIAGKPMIQHVWEKAHAATLLNELIVATDDQRIFEAVNHFGGKAVMTSADVASGTDRVWAAAKNSSAQIIVNIQGDEPLMKPAMVDTIAEALTKDSTIDMATLRFPMTTEEGYHQPNVVKVVTDLNGWVLYFSRSPLPGVKPGQPAPFLWYKHLGIYGYRREVLAKFVQWSASPLEQVEGLEQLRALEHGMRIKVLDSATDTVGVDTPEDRERVEKIIKEMAPS